MDIWTFHWAFWIVGPFLAYELYAFFTHQRTLTRQTQNWFALGLGRADRRYWLTRNIIFCVFWSSLGGHFLFGWPALWSVVLPGVPFAAVIGLSSFIWKDATISVPQLDQEGVDMKSFLGKVWNGLKGGAGWMLRRGPLWSALLVGASVVVPGAAPILKTLAAALASVSGGSVDQQTVEAFGVVISGALLLLGSVRKFWRIAKPQLLPR